MKPCCANLDKGKGSQIGPAQRDLLCSTAAVNRVPSSLANAALMSGGKAHLDVMFNRGLYFRFVGDMLHCLARSVLCVVRRTDLWPDGSQKRVCCTYCCNLCCNLSVASDATASSITIFER